MSRSIPAKGTPFLHDKRIEEEANLLLAEWEQRRGPVEVPVPIDDIIELHCELIYEIDDLRARFNHDDVLGAIWFDDQIIRIDQSLDPHVTPRMLGRYRFTLAHEAGHWRLHRHQFRRDDTQPEMFDGEGKPSFVCRSTQRPPEEIQADKFAAALLMPRPLVFSEWATWHGDHAPACLLDLDVPDIASDPKRNQAIALERFCKPFADRFQVSAEAMRIRLEGLELLVRERPNLLFT